MKLYGTDMDRLKDLQDQFNKFFPYLKLEFYNKPHSYRQASRGSDMLDANARIAAYRQGGVEIEIDNKMTGGMLEKKFEELGLPVQIFRKLGRLWIETCLTDNWSLEQQNSEGAIISGAA